MTQTSKLVSGGLALLLISSAGCAGNGLRNMFSRNETAGYKTLEELEAERAEKESAAADAEGPKFASWLPFGKKTSEDSEAVASAETDTTETDTSGSWWRNPFRRQETVEADPFLTEESDKEVAAAGKRKLSKSKGPAEIAEVDDSEVDTSDAAKNLVKAVSDVKEADQVVEDDDVLMKKFEKHFEQNTAEAVDVVDEAAPLIVAGKSVDVAKTSIKTKTAAASAVADDRLLEFEKLIAEKKTAVAKQKQGAEDFAEESVIEEFASSVGKETESNIQSAGNQIRNTAESFDSLLAASETSPRKVRPAANALPNLLRQKDVNVADQENLFGSVQATSKKPGDHRAPGDEQQAWSSPSEEADDFSWAQPKPVGKSGQKDLAKKVLDSTVDQFAAMFSAARTAEAAPAANLPDAPEGGAWSAASSPDSRSANTGRQGKSGSIKVVSSARQLPAEPETPKPLQEDPFFASATPATSGPDQHQSADTQLDDSAVVSTRSSARPLLNLRTFVLLIGGIIVAALLFAPGRKKPIHTNQLPLQG